MPRDLCAIAERIKEDAFHDGWHGNSYTGVGTQDEGSFDLEACEQILEQEFGAACEDAELLDWLQSQSQPEPNWVCRSSDIGRGMRLHESKSEGRHGFPTAREALRAARANQQEGKDE